MKKYLILILIPLLFGFQTTECDTDKCPGPSYELAAMNPYVAGTVKAAISCSTSTDFIGRTTATNYTALAGDTVYVFKINPTCASGCTSGTLAKAFIGHKYASKDYVKVCIWSANAGETTPMHADNTVIHCTTAIYSEASEWASQDVNDHAITCGNYYWVGFVPSGTDWNIVRDASGGADTVYGQAIAGAYANPESVVSTLNQGTWTAYTEQTFNVYFTIGP